MGRLQDRVALITGAGSGMGEATAKRFAAEGARVVAVDITGEEERTAAEIGGAATPMHADVSVADDVSRIVADTVAKHGRLDTLCNVAGIHGTIALIPEYTEEDFDRVVAVNLKGVWLGMKYAIPAIVDSGGGSVINWSSLGGLIGASSMSAYLGSKGGVVQMTKGAALEYGPQGVRVNTICPGHVVTPMADDIARSFEAASDDAKAAGRGVQDHNSARAALARSGHPEEVASVALFLASEDASFVSGAALPVDGGWLAGG